MELDLIEQTVKNKKIAPNFQTADAIWPIGPCNCIYRPKSYI